MIIGLTVLKNATKMGYPWVESILSVIDKVDHFHIGEGYSDDGTLDIVKRLAQKYAGKISVSRFEWPQMDTGFAIGAATNDALRYVRHLGGKILYVQADELWHPESVSEMLRLSVEDYDSYNIPFLHLEHNCQVIQEGSGYQFAIRMVSNEEHIISHRDAWTFEGVNKTLTVMSLPHKLVHCNYCFWENVPIKKRVQADELYTDLAHYGAAADRAEGQYDAGMPELFAKTDSPFEHHLSPVFVPMLGQPKYFVREELLV